MPWTSLITENSHLSSKTVLSKNPKQAQSLVQTVYWGLSMGLLDMDGQEKEDSVTQILKDCWGNYLGQGYTLLDGAHQWWSVSHFFLLTTLNFYIYDIFPYQFFPSLPMVLNLATSLLSVAILCSILQSRSAMSGRVGEGRR